MSEKLLREFIRLSFKESLIMESALKSEVHLADSINTVVENSGQGSLDLVLGTLGTKRVFGARKSGGGVPEPKADIIIETSDGDIGVSMKAPNYDFLQNRMQIPKFTEVFTAAGVDEDTIAKMISGLADTCRSLAAEYADAFSLQKERLISAAQSVDPAYTFPDPVWRQIKREGGVESPMAQALIATGGWRAQRGTVRSTTEIPTSKTKSSIKDAINNDAFVSFMTDILAGPESMRAEDRANAMLEVYVPEVTGDIDKVQSYLDNMITIPEAVVKYSETPPKMRLIYRSEAATRASQSESNRFYAIKDPIAETPAGTDLLKWTVSVVK